ncbi:hypothetical protein Hdeb2414_s0004g00130241 [Helianthus debilis subsp. tardiflorus]
MAKTIEDAKTTYATLEADSHKEIENREAILPDVNKRFVEAEVWATKAEEEIDDLATMNANLVADRTWMQNFGVIYVTALSFVANTILDAPENTDAVAEVVGHAREVRYKAGYTECLTHVSAESPKKFTDERCALREVYTKAALKAAPDAYDGLVIPTLAQIKECLGVDDFL